MILPKDKNMPTIEQDHLNRSITKTIRESIQVLNRYNN